MSFIVVTLTIAAFVLSAYFCLTWGFYTVRAKRSGHARVSWFGIVDYSGLQVMVFIYTSLSLIYFVQVEVPPAEDWNSIVRRTVLYLIIVMIAGIRTARWVMVQNPRWARPLIRLATRIAEWRYRRETKRIAKRRLC